MRLLRLTSPAGDVQHILPDGLSSFQKYYWHPAATEEVDACGYNVGAGYHPARCGNPEPCPEHAALVCDCGLPATGGCCHAGSLAVCGRPVCVTHQTCAHHTVSLPSR